MSRCRKYNSSKTTQHCPASFNQTGLSILTWSLLWELMAPGFFFFFMGLGEVSVGEWPLEEWVGLDTFLFWGTSTRSADPGGSGTGHGRGEIKYLIKHQTNVTTALLTSGQMLLERIYFISFNNRTVLNLADCRHSSLLAYSFSIQGQQRLKRCNQTTRRHICWLLTQALKTRFQEQCYLFTRVATLTLELSYNL